MQSAEMRKNHIRAFQKLSITERLSWAFGHYAFCAGFMDKKAKKINKIIRKRGKKYFKHPDLA
jgi:hypothetical protein